MQFQMSLFNATGLGLTFLYSLIILISSVFKKNRTLLFPPFITMCVMVTALQLTAFLEWLWMPGVYPRLLFRFLFVLEYVLSFLSAAAFYWYARSYFHTINFPLDTARSPREKKYLNWGIALCAAASLLFLSSIGTGWFYTFDADGMSTFTLAYPLVFAFGGVWSVLTILCLIQNHRHLSLYQLLLMLGYVLVPTGCFIADAVTRMSLGCMATAVIFFMIYSHVDNVQGERLLTQTAELARLDVEMTETKMELMMSQIQPHFLYNALSSIAYLCTEDPAEAEVATNEFSSYLKGNLQFIGAKSPIPFPIELNHVEQYLNIEKRRFADRLHIVYDIRSTEFRIPALTLQTLVENAVRYSVNARYEPTTVSVSAEETEQEYVVKIADDGPGFDPTASPNDDRRHIGLSGARLRLQEMVGGYLDIDSVIGQGTTVTIHIPKEGQA